MGTQIAQAVDAAGAGRIAAPLALLSAMVVFMGQPALGVLRHDGPDLADGAGGHQIPGILGGHMAGISVGHHEEKALLLGQGFQLRGLGIGDGHRLITGNMDARIQKGLADLIVGDIGRHYHHKVDAVVPGSLLFRHLPIIGIAAGRVHAQLPGRLPGLFRMGGKDAGHQLGGTVQGDGPAVRIPK